MIESHSLCMFHDGIRAWLQLDEGIYKCDITSAKDSGESAFGPRHRSIASA